MEIQKLPDFLVYELADTGEKILLKNITPQTLQSVLHSKQVLIIVRRDLKRIFIWKGSAAPVQKRFISSQVAIKLREELTENCRIISVDQGDEPQEFLDAFGLKSMPVSEVLEDMHYVRNIEKEGKAFSEPIPLSSKMKKEPKYVKKTPILSITNDDGKKIIQLLTTIDQNIKKIIKMLEKSL
ncbi:MAG: hypothetical protein ACFE9C_08490 [Candidatus Hodarchaeota archaeon]